MTKILTDLTMCLAYVELGWTKEGITEVWEGGGLSNPRPGKGMEDWEPIELLIGAPYPWPKLENLLLEL